MAKHHHVARLRPNRPPMDDRCSIQQHGCILRLEYIRTRHPHGKDLVCVCTFMQMCLRCRQNWELNNALEYSNRCSHRHIYIMRHQGQFDFSPLSCMSVHVVKLHRRENDNFESPKRQRCNHNQHGQDIGNRAELNLKQHTYDFC